MITFIYLFLIQLFSDWWIDQTNPCDSSPCKHGGTCTPTINGYTCTCPSNYGGTNCDSKYKYGFRFRTDSVIFNKMFC